MNTTQENNNANATQGSGTEVKKKRSFFRGFLSFMMYGGWILMIIIIVGIVIAVQILTK
jgi:hypothetical protein